MPARLLLLFLFFLFCCVFFFLVFGAQAVGDGKPNVGVTVYAEHGVVGIRGVFDDVFDQLAVFAGLGIADGIGHVDGGGPGVDDLGEHADEEVRIGTRGVLGGKFHVVRVGGTTIVNGHGHLEHVFGVLAQFVLHMQGRGGQEGGAGRGDPGELPGDRGAVLRPLSV